MLKIKQNWGKSKFEVLLSSSNTAHMINTDITDSRGKWLSWGCRVEIWFHLSEPLFSPPSCLRTLWTGISLQFSPEATVMSHAYLAHQYFTTKPNLLGMTTYHRQDVSFTPATFTSRLFSVFAKLHRDMYICIHTHMCKLWVKVCYILWWFSFRSNCNVTIAKLWQNV